MKKICIFAKFPGISGRIWKRPNSPEFPGIPEFPVAQLPRYLRDCCVSC